MQYLAGGHHDRWAPIVEHFAIGQGFLLDRKRYSYFMFYKGEVIEDIDSPDGVVIYSDFTGYSVTMDVYTPNYLTKGMIKKMFSYPFDELKIVNLFGAIESDNTKSITTFNRLGCTPVSCIDDYYGAGNHRLIYWTNRENVERWID